MKYIYRKMDKKNVLIVEDDPNLGQILSEYLNIKGYNTTLSKDGEEGFSAYKNQTFDLCILDIMMPKKDGFTLAKEIRAIDKKTPIIFLTAKSMKEDTIQGLKIGADDFMTKPFSMEELILRMQAVLRRVSDKTDQSENNSVIRVGKFIFDTNSQELESDGEITK